MNEQEFDEQQDEGGEGQALSPEFLQQTLDNHALFLSERNRYGLASTVILLVITFNPQWINFSWFIAIPVSIVLFYLGFKAFKAQMMLKVIRHILKEERDRQS